MFGRRFNSEQFEQWLVWWMAERLVGTICSIRMPLDSPNNGARFLGALFIRN